MEKDSDTDRTTICGHLTYFAKLGIIKKRTVRIDLGLNPETGKKEYTTDYYVQKQAYFQARLPVTPSQKMHESRREASETARAVGIYDTANIAGANRATPTTPSTAIAANNGAMKRSRNIEKFKMN